MSNKLDKIAEIIWTSHNSGEFYTAPKHKKDTCYSWAKTILTVVGDGK